jgi:DNA-binding transcriptional MerR regulator
MPDTSEPIEIPKRALFKSAEVCDLVKVQPYVLRTWEAEFPELGIAKAAGAARVYRREDVERVVRIKHLLLVDGLTLAGARRKLEEETMPVAPDEPELDELIGRNARERLTEVKRGLRSILDLLGGRTSAAEFRLSAPSMRPASRGRHTGKAQGNGRASKPVRGHSPAPRSSASPRRKRSA